MCGVAVCLFFVLWASQKSSVLQTRTWTLQLALAVSWQSYPILKRKIHSHSGTECGIELFSHSQLTCTQLRHCQHISTPFNLLWWTFYIKTSSGVPLSKTWRGCRRMAQKRRNVVFQFWRCLALTKTISLPGHQTSTVPKLHFELTMQESIVCVVWSLFTRGKFPRIKGGVLCASGTFWSQPALWSAHWQNKGSNLQAPLANHSRLKLRWLVVSTNR